MHKKKLNLERWRSDGFIHIERFLSAPALAELRNWIDDIESWPAAGPCLQHDEMTELGPQRARSENFVPYHNGMRWLATQGCLLQIASDLLGEPAVLFKEKLNYKHPGGAGYAPHQDIPAYPGLSRCVTCLVSVDDATEENGCLEFAPGNHRDLLTQGNDGCIAPNIADALAWRRVPAAAGSLVWFDGLIPHRSGDNRGERSRRALYLTYNALSEGDRRSRYYQQKELAFAAESRATERGNERLSLINHFRGRAVTATEGR
jgi:ectoine hydroxylase-related dioxygenase (phytanoyl-CoA dioxygenase family)